MSCYYPKKGFCIGIDPKTGKKKMRIVPWHYTAVSDMNYEKAVYDYVPIPCGNCLGCHLDYARSWALRCSLEASYYDSNYFVTLTYDDENNPRNLLKDDLRAFIKKLRTYLEREGKPEIRFFASGEYGSSSLRPHFHAIFFNLVLDDLKLYKYTVQGKLYTSEFLSKIWNKGFVIVAECNYKTCGYVARYCMKKFDRNQLKDYGFNKEFILMSRKPGIGYGYFLDHKDEIYKYDTIYFKFTDKMAESTPPSYFDRKFEELDPELLQNVKNLRKAKAEYNSTMQYLNTTLANEVEYFKTKEAQKKISIKGLKRSSC